MKIEELFPAIMLSQNIQPFPSDRRNKEWNPEFCPRAFVKTHSDISLETYQLGERRLKNLGLEVSKERLKFR